MPAVRQPSHGAAEVGGPQCPAGWSCKLPPLLADADSRRFDGTPTASTGGGDAESGAYALEQTFDMGIEVTGPVFNRIRRIPKTCACPGSRPVAGQSFEQG